MRLLLLLRYFINKLITGRRWGRGFVRTVASLFLVFCLLFVGSKQAKASHMAGGELTYTWLFGTTYQFTATFYRDCAGVSAPGNLFLTIQSASCGVYATFVMGLVAGTGQEITYPCSTVTTTCQNVFSTYAGYQKWQYQVTVNLASYATSSGGLCTDWVFSFTDCCRNGAINTIQTPGSDNMYIEATLNNVAAPTNSSPVFNNLPVIFLCNGQTYSYNPGGYDSNGDSLVYGFISPRTNSGVNVVFIAPYSATNPISSSPPATINSSTGEITMTPNQNQIGITTIIIYEYRNGVLIGSVIRDMQFIVLTCTNNLPTATGINGTNVFSTSVCPGSTVCFTINSNDIDASQIVSMTWSNTVSGATFTSSGGSHPTGTFCWTPTAAQARTAPYTFTVVVRDNSCPYNGVQSYVYSIYVLPLSVSSSILNISCNGGNNGSASVLASGTPPYTYSWSTGQTVSSISSLSSGSYTVTVRDANGCTSVLTLSVTQPAVVSASLSGSSVLCNGGSTGTATVTASGGTSPYTYTWSNGQNTSSASGLSPGTYTVTITDSRGCTRTASQTIAQPTALSSTATQTIGSCSGGSTGAANVVASGGTTAYSYLWSNGRTNSAITSLSAGTYTVTVTDANGCRSTQSVTVSASPAFTVASTSTGNTNPCSGTCNGAATISVSGGAPSYTYTWSNGQSTSAASALCGGSYDVTVSDANNCTSAVSITVTQPATVLAATANTNVLCNGGNNGAASVTATGGTAPFSYSWNTGSSSTSLSNLTAGNYIVTITDANNCRSIQTITVSQPTALVLSSSAVASCSGPTNGSASVTASGGTSAYSYLWSNGSNSSSISSLSGATYTVTVTDANGCSTTTTATVGAIPAPVVSSASICNGQTSGTLTVSGGASYVWSTGSTSTSITVSPSSNTSYTVTVTNSAGCTASASTTVTVNALPTVTATTVPASGQVCSGSSINITASGGVSYVWSPSTGLSATTGNVVSASPTGSSVIYTVIATDANGCTSIATRTIIPKLVPVFSFNPITLCSGSIVRMSLSYFNSSSILYTWSPATGLNTTIGTPTTSTSVTRTYTVTGNLNGCISTSTVTVTVVANPTVSISASSLYICNGNTVTLTASGGGHLYSWTPSTGLSSTSDSIITATPSGTTTYTVYATDANGCTAVSTVTLSPPSYSVSANPSTICAGSNAQLSANGCGNYQWTPSSTLSNSTISNPVASPTTTTTYSVVMTCGACSDTLPVTVTVYPPPATPTITKSNDTLCSSTSSSYTGYQWYYNGNIISGATDTCLYATSSGTYSVQVTDQYGCTTMFSAPPVILPIELLFFNASAIESSVALSWSTASEVNNDYFTIEKSDKGENFIEVLRMKGAGNSSTPHSYKAIDRDPYEGISYYRLKQTDFDGKFTFSSVVAVDMEHLFGEHLKIFPNPSSNEITVLMPPHGDEAITMSVFNVLGETLQEETISAQTVSSNAVSNHEVLNIKDLEPGIYFVRVVLQDSEMKWLGKFIKK